MNTKIGQDRSLSLSTCVHVHNEQIQEGQLNLGLCCFLLQTYHNIWSSEVPPTVIRLSGFAGQYGAFHLLMQYKSLALD